MTNQISPWRFVRYGIVALIAGAASISQAQATSSLSSSIGTARPSFSSAATTLEKNHWQFEGGYQYTSNDGAGGESDAHTAPFVFVRAGVSEQMEVNLFWSGYTDIDTNRGDIDGTSDLSLGASYQLSADDSKLAVSIFGAISIPVGSDDFSSDDVDPSLGLAWAYALDSGPSLFGTIVANSASSNNERETQLGTAIGIARSLSERIGAYVEYFSVHSDTSESAHSIGGGITYLVSNDVQLDINAGGGLNNIADDFFLGCGIGWRF